MWYTTRTEGFDATIPKNRAPFLHDYLASRLGTSLRCGLGYKLLALLGFYLCYYAFEGRKIFSFNLAYTTENMRNSNSHNALNILFQTINMVSAIWICIHWQCLSDDAAWARGFRAGSKILGSAATLDTISQSAQLAAFVWLFQNYSDNWWDHNYSMGGVEWYFLGGARAISAAANLLYGLSFFLLEVYHDDGTNEWHACLNLCLYAIAGLHEASGCGWSTISLSIAHISAFLWALPFEEELNECSGLHESELVNQVEEETNKYANLSPYQS